MPFTRVVAPGAAVLPPRAPRGAQRSRARAAMVWFQCESCGDTLKKPKLPAHYQRCACRAVSCVDCGQVRTAAPAQPPPPTALAARGVRHMSCGSMVAERRRARARGPRARRGRRARMRQGERALFFFAAAAARARRAHSARGRWALACGVSLAGVLSPWRASPRAWAARLRWCSPPAQGGVGLSAAPRSASAALAPRTAAPPRRAPRGPGRAVDCS